MITIQTAEASRTPPAIIHPVVTAVPKKHTTPNKMTPIQMKHEASKRMTNLDG